jgi:transposase-like protein
MRQIYDKRIFDDLSPDQRVQAADLSSKGIPLYAIKGFFRDHVNSRTATYDVVNAAIRIGLLKRPTACQKCSATRAYKDGRKSIQAHHDDYNKPLEVRWLCAKCHSRWHSKNKAIERSRLLPTPADLAKAEQLLAEAARLRDAVRLEADQRQREWEAINKQVDLLRKRAKLPQ